MIHVQTSSIDSRIYRSYLVRFWQSNEQGNWRASAQCVQTANVVMFGDVASLFAFLQCEIEGKSTEDAITSTQNPAHQNPARE